MPEPLARSAFTASLPEDSPTVAERITAFNRALRFPSALPEGVRVMNPFQENPSALAASSAFYKKYYGDHERRHLILGINPGRFGAGLTGVPFTDPKRIREVCGITEYHGPPAHEPSSVFIYDMIARYGGAERFYRHFYINSICPLGFTVTGKNGREVNANYYDMPALAKAALPFAVACIQEQLAFTRAETCFCLGNGKNADFLIKLNKEYAFFERIIPLEHPRFVMQYRAKRKDEFIDKYLVAFAAVTRPTRADD